MINVVDKQVNTKLIGGGGQNSNLTKLNNNINKDYEVTSSNTSLS